MIYYFSGTGNSRYAARFLGERLKEDVVAVNDCNPEFQQPSGKSIGLVFPVYSWGVAPVMLDFISRLPQAFWREVKSKDIPVWAVMTCGDETALAPEMLDKALKRRGVKAQSVWSLIMPNNYVLLPGFDVDPKEVEKRKLKAAPARLAQIAKGIKEGRKTVDVVRGSLAWLKTKLVFPLFEKWGIQQKKWHTSGGCIGCGVCVRSCPLGNMHMEGDRPVWGPDCCSCLACYHNCPRHAVEYDGMTQKKGQYRLEVKDQR